jgi:hypothetical protein
MVDDEVGHPLESVSSLPFSSKWRYRPYFVAPFTLAPGAERPLIDLRKHGYIIFGGVTASSLNLSVRIELETASETDVQEVVAAQLLAAGWVFPMNSSWWISGNFPLIPSYTIVHSPSPWTPFSKRLKLTLLNRSPAPIVYSAAIMTIEFLE